MSLIASIDIFISVKLPILSEIASILLFLGLCPFESTRDNPIPNFKFSDWSKLILYDIPFLDNL